MPALLPSGTPTTSTEAEWRIAAGAPAGSEAASPLSGSSDGAAADSWQSAPPSKPAASTEALVSLDASPGSPAHHDLRAALGGTCSASTQESGASSDAAASRQPPSGSSSEGEGGGGGGGGGGKARGGCCQVQRPPGWLRGPRQET